MSRIRLTDGLRGSGYGAIHEAMITRRIERLREGGLMYSNAIDDMLHDLVEPIFEDVMEELTKHVKPTAEN